LKALFQLDFLKDKLLHGFTFALNLNSHFLNSYLQSLFNFTIMIPFPMFHQIGFVELLLKDLVEQRQKLSDFEMGFLFEGEQKPQSVRKHL
jgi:hypothetical protein